MQQQFPVMILNVKHQTTEVTPPLYGTSQNQKAGLRGPEMIEQFGSWTQVFAENSLPGSKHKKKRKKKNHIWIFIKNTEPTDEPCTKVM